MSSRKWSAIALMAMGVWLAGRPAIGGGMIKSPELLDRIQVGTTSKQEVIQLLGPPESTVQFSRRGVESMDYWIPDHKKRTGISIEVDGNGVVRNVLRLPQYGP